MRRAALVTGASSGIGAATCRRLRDEGWHVVGLARRPSPDASASLCVDITRFADVLEAFQTVPRLRLLVHAAATIGPVAPLQVSDPDDWRRAVEINLLGTYNVLRAALAGPLARRRRHGHPPDERSRIDRKALLERVQRLEGGRRAPRPLRCDRRRRHRLRHLLARSGDHRDPDAARAALSSTSPTETGSCACTRRGPGGRRKRSRRPSASCRGASRARSTARRFGWVRSDGPGRDRDRGVRAHASGSSRSAAA